MRESSRYLADNLVRGFLTSPFKVPIRSWLMAVPFAFVALLVGFGAGLFQVGWLDSPIAALIPFITFVFPSLLEEAFFRGVLIPRDRKSVV